MQPIKPFLWFDTQAEEAVKLYTSLFEDGKITATTYYPEGAPMPAGTVMTVAFEMRGAQYVAMNGGPIFKFTPAISFSVMCETQAEIDKLWDALTTNGGKPVQCGWLEDRYGLSWQIVPAEIEKYSKSGNAMKALMGMVKLDIAELERAYNAK